MKSCQTLPQDIEELQSDKKVTLGVFTVRDWVWETIFIINSPTGAWGGGSNKNLTQVLYAIF